MLFFLLSRFLFFVIPFLAMKNFFCLLSLFLLSSCFSSNTTNEIESLKRSVGNLRSYQLEQASEISRLSEELQKSNGVIEELQHYKEEMVSNQDKVAVSPEVNIQPELVGNLASDKITAGEKVHAIVPEDILAEDEIFASKQSIEFGREMLEMLENIKANKFREALTIINDLMTSAVGEQQSRVLFWQGICSDAVGNNKEALIAYNSLLTTFKNHPRAPRALYNQALVFLRLRDKNAAKLSLQKLIKEYSSSEYKAKAEKKLKDI